MNRESNLKWFAVDIDGNVALFDTGESGVVPAEVEPVSDIDVILDTLIGNSSGKVEYCIDDILQGPGHKLQAHLKEGFPIWFCLLIPKKNEQIEQLCKAENARRLPNSKTPLIYFDSLSCHDLKTFLDQDLIAKGWIDHRLDLERFGLFIYESDDFGDGESYVRQTVPAVCMQADDLPNEISVKLGVMKFEELKFLEETDVILPT